jgi:hypothetical protein
MFYHPEREKQTAENVSKLLEISPLEHCPQSTKAST